ncbi:MAG: alpha/beta fold hydrolase [Bacteroidota bacterium]
MPLVPSNYNPPFLFRNGHFSTIYAGVIRRVHGLLQKRERLELSDGDFMDLDWSDSRLPTQKVAILLHGLEGDAQRHYITGSAKKLNYNHYDVCAVNFRGCSGVPNRLYRSYHSGVTEDLIEVIQHVLNTRDYNEIYLLGFSLGGNLSLKYLGEGNHVPHQLKAAVAVSVPCDLKDACDQLLSSKNVLYSARFKKHLLAKLRTKRKQFPDKITEQKIKAIVTLKDFDDTYTAPAHGFNNALDYYTNCSSNQFLEKISVPTLILNAKNDTFLGAKCFPYKEAEKNPHLYLEAPDFGGHVGFWGRKNSSYAEKRAVEFFNSVHLW